MADSEGHPSEDAATTPNFELPRREAITEANWAEYQARGFEPWEAQSTEEDSVLDLRSATNLYGAANVYTGPPYSQDEQRPLQHMPGVGIYVSPEGIAYAKEQERLFEQRQQAAQSDELSSPDDSAAS